MIESYRGKLDESTLVELLVVTSCSSMVSWVIRLENQPCCEEEELVINRKGHR